MTIQENKEVYFILKVGDLVMPEDEFQIIFDGPNGKWHPVAATIGNRVFEGSTLNYRRRANPNISSK